MSFASSFVRRAGSIRTPIAVLAGVLLAAPSIGAGFALDDHIGRVFVHGLLGEQGPALWDLFRIVGSQSMRDFMVREGWLPWWASAELRVAFLRPLASLGHTVDYGLLPAWAAHLHSLVWLSVLIPCAALAYRRLGEASGVAGGVVAVATVLFAVDDAHASAAGWIASRNAIAAPALSLLALALHARGAASTTARPSAAGLLALGCALGFGEMAYGVLGYFAGYALFIDARPRRFVAILPYFALCLAFMVLGAALGYGAAGSGLYVSPLTDPVRFTAAAMERLPLLLGAALFLPPADLWPHVASPGRLALTLSGLASVVLCAILFARRLAGDPLARCFALGTVASAVILSATFPADRLLTLPGFGAAGLVARYLVSVSRRPTRPARAFSVALITVHAGLAVLLSPVRALATRPFSKLAERGVDTAVSDEPADFVVVVRAPDPMCSSLRFYLASHGIPVGVAQCLAATPAPAELARPAPNRLVVTPLGGFLPTRMDTLMRPRADPFTIGDEVAVRGMRARVVAVLPDGRPARVEFTFTMPLERARLLEWAGDGYRNVRLPPVGTRKVLSGG